MSLFYNKSVSRFWSLRTFFDQENIDAFAALKVPLTRSVNVTVNVHAGDWSWASIIWTSVGCSVSVGLGLLCCIYVATLHENDLWFSNIKVGVVQCYSLPGSCVFSHLVVIGLFRR